MAKVKDLKTSVVIANGFPGTYKWTGGTSYYLNGVTGNGEVHFSVNEPAHANFTRFHVTYSISGTNVGIWFIGDKFNNANIQSVPAFKMDEWKNWWTDNKANVESAAKDFWKNVQ